MRITLLCDGDVRLKYPEISGGDVAVNDLGLEYFLYQWREAGEQFAIAIRDLFRPTLEQAARSFKEFFDQYNLSIDAIGKTLPERRKWYNPENWNNYRKMHHITMRRIARSRQRPRESHRVLYGTSADAILFDELHGIERDKE